MATITASASGGDWSDTSAWVGGVVPAIADDVVINGTSGNITVTSNQSCLTINFSGHTGTFAINSGFTLSIGGATITLGSGMTYDPSQTGVLACVNNTATLTINFNGVTIPYLSLGRVSPGQIKTVTISGVNPTINNLVIANGASNAAVVFAGVGFTIKNSLNTTLGACRDAAITFDNSGGIVTIQGGASHSYVRSTANTASYTITSGTTLEMLSNIYINGTSTTTGGIIFQSGSFLTHNSFTLLAGGAIRFDTSVVEWFIISFIANGQSHTLLSDLNTIDFQTSFNIAIVGTVTFNVNIRGNYLGIGGCNFTNRNVNFIGTGTIETTANITNAVININTSDPLGYTLGSVTRPTTILTTCVLNLVGTSICTVFNTVSHTLQLGGSCTINTNNTATGANIVGGSQIIWGNISLTGNQTTTLIYDTIALGNLFSASHTLNGVGIKLYVAGNLSVTTLIQGTATIELDGSVNKIWGSGIYRVNIVVNKSSGAIVTTAAGTITWGFANRTLTMNSTVDFITNSTTFTLSGTPLTINNSSASQFNNVTLLTNVTLNMNGATTPIIGTLSLLGNATFAGTHGWTCGNLTCSTANSTIILQAGVTYTTTASVNMLGSNAQRITMRSNTPTVLPRAIWTLQNPSSQSMVYVNGQGIDSSAGSTIWSFGGTISTALIPLNWAIGSPPATKAFTFVC